MSGSVVWARAHPRPMMDQTASAVIPLISLSGLLFFMIFLLLSGSSLGAVTAVWVGIANQMFVIVVPSSEPSLKNEWCRKVSHLVAFSSSPEKRDKPESHFRVCSPFDGLVSSSPRCRLRWSLLDRAYWATQLLSGDRSRAISHFALPDPQGLSLSSRSLFGFMPLCMFL